MSVRDRNMRLGQLRNAGVKVTDASTNKVVPFYPSSARSFATESPASTSSGVPASSRAVSASDIRYTDRTE